MLAVSQYLFAVHEDLFYAGRILVRFRKRGVVRYCCRIEYDDVSEVALSKTATITNLNVPGGEEGHATNSLLKWDDAFVYSYGPS